LDGQPESCHQKKTPNYSEKVDTHRTRGFEEGGQSAKKYLGAGKPDRSSAKEQGGRRTSLVVQSPTITTRKASEQNNVLSLAKKLLTLSVFRSKLDNIHILAEGNLRAARMNSFRRTDIRFRTK
jgi:hypothetical protein